MKGQVELYVLLHGKVWHFQPVRNLQTWASQTSSCLCKDTKRFPRTSLPPIVLKILRR
jgi:hypothetical protein